MRLTLDPLRVSLLAALGLLACNPKPGEDTSDSQSGTTADPGTTTSVTSGPTTASETTASTSDGTGVSASGTGGTGSTSGLTTTGEDTGPGTITSVDDTGAPLACDGTITEILQGNTDPPLPSGFEMCDDGIIHRAEKVDCSVPATPTDCMDFTGGGNCESDADCTDKPFGSCHQDMIFGGVVNEGGTCSCVYGCQSDSDCADGQICRCGGDSLGLYTECVAAPDCTVDADCPVGEICGLSPDICAPGGFLLACTTPNDLCAGDSECLAPPCTFITDHWECSNAACGRPFLVEATTVTAPTVARDDWRGLVRAPTTVDEATATRLAAYWTRIGQFEHASVASFAQFVLQLLAVGAGPELVLAAQQALADEVEHARLVFALASLYAGTGVGPGPLAIGGALPVTELAGLVDAVIREACVGESLAAFEAREAAAQAVDPGVQAALRRISEDEQRHAELGWRFVQWALATDPALHGRARATFAAAVAEAKIGVARDAAAAGTPELHMHGVIDEPLRAEIWGRGLTEVIEPCAAALLAVRLAA
jgi:hypothetical protein